MNGGLSFEQVRRNRGAIALEVHRARDDFLAGPGFAGNQHRRQVVVRERRFGHRTDARERKYGLVEAADGPGRCSSTRSANSTSRCRSSC
jgi:hypothetical protein